VANKLASRSFTYGKLSQMAFQYRCAVGLDDKISTDTACSRGVSAVAKLLVIYITHTRLMALCTGLPGWARTRKVKTIWILLKQKTVSGSGISWAICTSAPHSRQITTLAPHCSAFYRPDALPAAQPTASKHCNLYQ